MKIRFLSSLITCFFALNLTLVSAQETTESSAVDAQKAMSESAPSVLPEQKVSLGVGKLVVVMEEFTSEITLKPNKIKEGQIKCALLGASNFGINVERQIEIIIAFTESKILALLSAIPLKRV